MSDSKPPKTPTGLGMAGRALWRSLVCSFEFEPWEIALVVNCCRQADTVAELEKVLADDGMVVAGSTGQRRLNGAVSELRQARIALAKLLSGIALPDESDRPQSHASRSAQRAANARWSRKRAEQARREQRLADDGA